MRITSCFGRLRAACAALMLAAALPAAANDYPTKPVKLVVTFAPGGANDIIGRLIAEQLSALWSQPVVVENRAGANGAIGLQGVANAPADGYTLVLGTAGPIVMSPAVQSVPFDPVNDFTPIVNLVDAPHVLAVHPKIPAATVRDFVRLAKQAPGSWNYSSPGIGNSGHLAMELLKLQTGIRITHVAYKGAAPALADLVAGHVEAYFTSGAALLPYAQSGAVKALAVTSQKRLEVLPDVPTMDESGMEGFDFAVFAGLLGPAGMPAAIVEKINADANKALKSPKFVEVLKKNGMTVWGGTPAEFAATISADLAKWKKVVQDGGIKAE